MRAPARLILVGAVAVGLAACADGIDTDELEDGIGAEAQSQVDDANVDATVKSVSCPDEIDDEVGTEYACRLEFSDGTSAVANGEVVEGEEQDEFEFTPVSE